MTGKEAIIHYLGTHKSFCAQDVAADTGSNRNLILPSNSGHAAK